MSLFPILLLHLHENPNAYAEHRSVKIPAPYIYTYIMRMVEMACHVQAASKLGESIPTQAPMGLPGAVCLMGIMLQAAVILYPAA